MKTALRIVVALVLSIVWAGLIPIFGEPFGGCNAHGYVTFELGCISWPEFVRGFGFVLIFMAIAPARISLHVVALTLLAVLSVSQEVRFNGLTPLQSADGLLLALARGLPIILGGLVAVGMYFGIRQFTQRYARDHQLNDR